MNRDQLISALAQKQGCSQAEAGRFLGNLESVIQTAVSNGQEVPTKLGKFLSQHRQARKGHNPQTGESVDIPAKDVPAFRPSKAFKDAVA